MSIQQRNKTATPLFGPMQKQHGVKRVVTLLFLERDLKQGRTGDGLQLLLPLVREFADERQGQGSMVVVIFTDHSTISRQDKSHYNRSKEPCSYLSILGTVIPSNDFNFVFGLRSEFAIVADVAYISVPD